MDYTIILVKILCVFFAFGAQGLPTESDLKRENVTDNNKLTGILQFPDQVDYNSTVLFYLYTKNAVDTPQELRINDQFLLKSSEFRSSRKTMVLIHGYNANVTSPITQIVKSALLEFQDVNVIAVDWSYFTKNINYLSVVKNCKGVGSFIGEFVDFLIDQTGLSPDRVHLIGHSIGAHASGFAAKLLKTKGREIARISGLDPAWPGFDRAESDGRLSSTDARFVDCIHSCAGELGFPKSICQADFYPNGGKNQPGCPWFDFGVCSHSRSYEYYAESINSSHIFEAQTCNSIVEGVPYACRNEGARMGYPTSNKFLGKFYLTTRSSAPYAKVVD